MSISVFKAIKTRWKAKNASNEIGDRVSGDTQLFFGIAHPRVTMPYAVVSNISNTPAVWTTHSEYRVQSVQIALYDDNLDDVGEIQKQLHVDFDFAALVLPADQLANGEVILDFRRTNDLLIQGDIDRSRNVQDLEVFQAVTTYDITRRLPVNYSPG